MPYITCITYDTMHIMLPNSYTADPEVSNQQCFITALRIVSGEFDELVIWQDEHMCCCGVY